MTPNKEVHEILKSCLFTEKELPEKGVPEGAILVEGVRLKVGFHPERLKAAKPRITELLMQLVHDDFLRDKGGGMSFLRLVEDRAGALWGEQRDAEALLCLALGTGQARVLVPKNLWAVFPGGVPYVAFDL